jgi:ornithine cyclodeaminase/alanine dehydrogenase-like protein (mu-crystallin family)
MVMSLGLIIEDIKVAKLVYEKAKTKRIGTKKSALVEVTHGQAM